MMTLPWRKSAGTLTSWWGTKKDRIMNNPITAVIRSGTSRFIVILSLGRHPLSEPMHAPGLEGAADDDDDDHDDLDEIGPLETPHQSGLAREIGAGGIQLLTDQSVVAGHHEERKL